MATMDASAATSLATATATSSTGFPASPGTAVLPTCSRGTVRVCASGASEPESNRGLFVNARAADSWRIARHMFNKAP